MNLRPQGPALALAAGALSLLAAAQTAQDGEEGPLLPKDTLPTPFVRTAPLGV